MRQVRHIMGMPVSIEVEGTQDEMIIKKAFNRFVIIDDKFSVYKTDSEVSKFASGELKESDLSAELKGVINECRKAESYTEGYFSAWYGGKFEPGGFVKGWAIAEAGKVIEKAGFKTYCIGAGGDILARSEGKEWRIGVQDPKDKSKILNKLSIYDGAVATSGNYERGRHIINPKTGLAADELLSVTVTGPKIILADILATACFAMGQKASEFIKKFPGYSIYIVKD